MIVSDSMIVFLGIIIIPSFIQYFSESRFKGLSSSYYYIITNSYIFINNRLFILQFLPIPRGILVFMWLDLLS